jgi:hypothetical protein
VPEENWRLGHKVRTFGGVRQDCDPGALPPWLFRNLINVRFSGGGLTERGGQSKVNGDSQLEGCVTGIIPGDATPSEFEETLYVLSADASPSADPGTAEVFPYEPIGGLGAGLGTVGHYATLQGTPGNDPEGAEETIVIGNRLSATITPDLNWTIEVSGNDLPTLGGSVGGVEGCCGGLAKFEGVWYEALVNISFGVRHYQVWKLVLPVPTPTLDRQFTGTPGSDSQTRVWLVVYQDQNELVAALEADALHRKSTAGVWSRVSMPAGCTINRNHLANVVELGGILYFTGYGPGGGHLLFTYDGTQILPLHSWAGSPGTYSPLEVHEGDLYYGINAGGTIQLGRYDGTNFDVVHTFTGANEIRQLVSVFSRLYALRGDTLESSPAPESAPWTVDDSTADTFEAGAKRRVR